MAFSLHLYLYSGGAWTVSDSLPTPRHNSGRTTFEEDDFCQGQALSTSTSDLLTYFPLRKGLIVDNN